MPSRAAGARIKAMTGAHAAAVLGICQAGIDEGNATFATRGRGVGCMLLSDLIASTKAAGIGQHHGRWRDVVLIERRSRAV